MKYDIISIFRSIPGGYYIHPLLATTTNIASSTTSYQYIMASTIGYHQSWICDRYGIGNQSWFVRTVNTSMYGSVGNKLRERTLGAKTYKYLRRKYKITRDVTTTYRISLLLCLNFVALLCLREKKRTKQDITAIHVTYAHQLVHNNIMSCSDVNDKIERSNR